MRRRIGLLFAATVLILFVLAAYRTSISAQEDDKQAAIKVVLAHEQACQTYDFDKLDSLHTPDARAIEESYPHPFEPIYAKAIKPTRTLASASTIIRKTQLRRCVTMLHGSP